MPGHWRATAPRARARAISPLTRGFRAARAAPSRARRARCGAGGRLDRRPAAAQQHGRSRTLTPAPHTHTSRVRWRWRRGHGDRGAPPWPPCTPPVPGRGARERRVSSRDRDNLRRVPHTLHQSRSGSSLGSLMTSFGKVDEWRLIYAMGTTTGVGSFPTPTQVEEASPTLAGSTGHKHSRICTYTRRS